MTTIAYNSQKSGYLAKCWNLTIKAMRPVTVEADILSSLIVFYN